MPPGIAPMSAYITPPAVDEAPNGEPRAYIWTSQWTESRNPERGGSVNRALTKPVPGENPDSGVKAIDHAIHLYVVYDQDSEDPYADSLFPSILDTVSWTLRVSTDPAVITDPNDGTITQLVDVGETIDGQMNVTALAGQRMYRYDALMVIPVTELMHS